MIDLRPLKKIAETKGGLFKDILSREPDFISEMEYIAKIPILLEILEKEKWFLKRKKMNQKKTLGKFLSNISIKGLIFELFLKNTREAKIW